MSQELARWAPGVSLEWAIASLVFGMVIFAIIVVRLWREYRQSGSSATNNRGVGEDERISRTEAENVETMERVGGGED